MTYPILNAAQTAAALPFAALVKAIAQASRELDSGAINAPERLVVPIDADSVLLCMPATARDVSVTKIITVHARNAKQGLPAIQGEVIVMDTASGKRLLQLDGPTVTGRRTAAVSMLGIQTLLGRDPKRAADWHRRAGANPCGGAGGDVWCGAHRRAGQQPAKGAGVL
jgi:1-piperideine-2-carboxylate/1-pyrroline-2-carboxylate reductase [NAD(P)H]